MARFRKARRSKSRGFMKARARRSGSSGLTPMNVMLAGAIYGAARPFVAKMLPDFFNFGAVDSDNVIVAAAGYYGMKKSGLVKAIGTVALASEVGIVAARMTNGAASDTVSNDNTQIGW